MNRRYCSAQMWRVWSDDHLYALWAEVEVRVLRAQAAAGVVPAVWVDRAEQEPAPDAEVVAEYEQIHLHQMVAFLDAWGPRNVHIGVASSDVQDLALWTQLCEATDLIGEALWLADGALGRLVERAAGMSTSARTHGQLAQVVDWGHLPVDHLLGLRRAWNRLMRAKTELCENAKLRGATGNYSAPAVTPGIEQAVLEGLGFTPTDSATQVAPRDVVVAWAQAVVGVALAARRVATQIRLDVQTGVHAATLEVRGEGSSSMPHKTNPAAAEQVCGLSSVVVALAGALDSTVALWGHRDLTNSSIERVTLPQIAAYTEHLLLALATAVDQVQPQHSPGAHHDSAASLAAAQTRGLGYFAARAAVKRGYRADREDTGWLGQLTRRLGLDGVRDHRNEQENGRER